MAVTVWLLPAASFTLIIPRLFATFFMHNMLQKEFKGGLLLMKFLVNHPQYFRSYDPNDEAEETREEEAQEKKGGHSIRIFYAFLLAFNQLCLAFCLELLAIIYLNTKDNLMYIFLSYATLIGIASFDTNYAESLKNNPILGAKGKYLYVAFHRSAIAKEGNPREHSCFLKVLRFLYKLLRIGYTSFFFYFAPFLMLLY